MAQFRSKPFGVTKNGDKVDEYIISNPGGLEISVLNYGCVIKNLFVPTKTGLVDVVVGHDTLADYEADFNSSGSTCCGAFVGRYANRIENAEFALGGKTYKLEANNGRNHLHGTFPRKIYDVKMFGDTLLMETESPAGEDGFPGNLKVSVRYILTSRATTRPAPRAASCLWPARRWISAQASRWAATSTPGSIRPPWRAAASTTAMSLTGPGARARASARGRPATRPASA